MASSVATEHIRSRFRFLGCDHDPGTTNATITSSDGSTYKYVDMKDYSAFGVLCVGTIFGDSSDITLLEIVASDAVTFSNIVVVKTSGTIALSAIGDQAWLECSAEEVAHLATTYDLRYVAARVTCGHAGHEAVVVYFAESNKPHAAITPSYILSGTETA